MFTSESLRFSVVIPAKNEAENLPQLVQEITRRFAGERFEIVIVDDGSTDATAAVVRELAAQNPQLRYVLNEQSSGKSAAILTGVCAAEAPMIVTLDADGQNDPRNIEQLLRLAQEPGVGLAAAQRIKHAHSARKQFSSRLANQLRSLLLNDQTRDSACGLKAFPREVFLRLPHFENMHRFLPALVLREGLAIRHLEVADRPRLYGRSKYGLFDRTIAGVVDLFGVWWLLRRRMQ